MPDEKKFIDYSHEVKLLASKPLRILLIAFSAIFLALGIIGIFLPVLPTTPFILLSAACFARSSPRFYNMLMNNAHVGPPLRRWKERRSISRRHKAIAISVILLTMVPSILFVIPILAVKIAVAFIGLAVIAFLLTVDTAG